MGLKSYAAVWARRLAEWARKTRAVSPPQKGFIPGEGCLEYSFLMRSLTEDAHRKRKFLHLVFFDLKNTFGSIPHQLLWFSLQRLGLPSEMMDVFRDVYQGSLFNVCTEDGLTDGIPQGWGVKQGCSLSPLLFNLAIEGLLRGIESSSARGYSFSPDLEVKDMSYADDLAIAASSEEDVRAMMAELKSSRLGPACGSTWQSAQAFPRGIAMVKGWSSPKSFDLWVGSSLQ